jgi:hypothetical protein
MRLTAILILMKLSVFAQTDAKQKLFEDFPKDYCECLSERDSSMNAIQFMEECLWNFLLKHQNDLTSLLSQNQDSIADIEIGKKLGLEITFGALPSLIKDCGVFTTTLREYRDVSLERLKVSKETVKQGITNMRTRRADIKNQDRLVTYFILLGMMHELDDDPISAIKSYEESIKVNPTLIAKALQSLLFTK